jgi:hypothetical protein
VTIQPGIAQLIDKVDVVELVRDRIAEILLVESEQQQQLARAANKNPELWRLRVYTEATDPWEAYIGDQRDKDVAPIVNVYWNASTDDAHASNAVERQKVTGTYHVDCYGYGRSRETAGGHVSGDQQAALEAQRVARLVRNIIMAGHYMYLGMRKVVSKRWRDSATAFQPVMDGHAVQHIMGVRLVFSVDFNELSLQTQGVPLAGISIGIERLSDGLVYLTASYPEPEEPTP